MPEYLFEKAGMDSRATDRAIRANANGDLVMGRVAFIHLLRPRSSEGFRQSKTISQAIRELFPAISGI